MDPNAESRRKAMPAWIRAADKRIQAAAAGSYSPWPYLAERMANVPVWLSEQGLGGGLDSREGDVANEMRIQDLQRALDMATRTGKVPQSPWLKIHY